MLHQTDKQQRGLFMAEMCNPCPRTLLSPISPTAHTRHLPGPGVLQGQEERWDEWEEILERVRDGNEDHDGESSRRDVLLIFKVAVGGHERLHARRRA